jgi:hypothetical protein
MMDDFDMFGDQTEIGEPGEHDLGLDNASEEAFYDPPPYEPPRNIISPDQGPIGRALGYLPDPTTLKGAVDIGLTGFSFGANKALGSLAQFLSGANTMLNAADRAGPPSSSSTKGFTQPGPHPDEGTPFDPEYLENMDTLFGLAYGAPPPPGAPPAMAQVPPMQVAPSMRATPLERQARDVSFPISQAPPEEQPSPTPNIAALGGSKFGETERNIDAILDKGVEFFGGLERNAKDFVENFANQFTGKSQNVAGPSGKYSPFGPPTQTAERDPSKYGDQDGGGAGDPIYPREASAPVAQTELAPINPAAYENYFMGYDPDYDPYLAGFVGQPNLYGRREVVAEGGGGIMNLQRQANQLAAQGRGGDTMLMHMRPDEVAGLASLGGVTRNPSTGLPEGFLLPALGAFLPGMMGLGGGSILGGALATGLGAGAGQALQSKMLGEEDPLKKGMMAGLTAGLGSAALGGFGQMFGGEVGGFSGSLTPETTAGLTKAGGDALGEASKRAGMFELNPTFPSRGPQLRKAGDAAREALAVNPGITGGTLGGLGGMAADLYAMHGAGSKMPEEGTSSKSFREPQVRKRTGLAQSGDLTSYGFGPEGLFFGEGVYAEDGGRPVKRMSPGGFARPLAMSLLPYKDRRSPFGGQGQGVQGSVSEATQNLGEAGNALQSATRQVQAAQGTLNPNQQRGGFRGGLLGGLGNLFGGSNQQQMLQEQQQLVAERAPYIDPRRRMMEEGGIASMPQEGGDAVALQVTQDAVEAVRGEHPEPEIAIESFVSYFGPEAFESLRRLVIQEESARTMGKADGLVNGDDGGRDDVQRGTIDGDQELNISGGEYIFSADDVALIGDGNTEAGARRLDEARDKLRRSARGTTERPAYMGEGAATEMMAEVMTT